MKTMIIAAVLAITTLATAASAHTVAPSQAAKPDFAKQLFDQMDRNRP